LSTSDRWTHATTAAVASEDQIGDLEETTRQYLHAFVNIISDSTLLRKKLRHLVQQPDKSDS